MAEQDRDLKYQYSMTWCIKELRQNIFIKACMIITKLNVVRLSLLYLYPLCNQSSEGFLVCNNLIYGTVLPRL